MDPLTIGLIVAGVGAFASGIGSLFDSKKKRKEAEAAKAYQEEQYNLKKEAAELEFKEAQRQANRNAQKANLQADLADKSLDIGERTLSNDINTAIDNLYLSQASDTWEWNQQAMSAGQSEGSAYASIAASGVRAGSSLTDAVEMQAATNSELLQFSQDSKRRSDNNNLGSVLNQLAGNEFNIMENRIGADETRKDALDLVNSYLEGGANYNLYQNQLEQMKSTNEYNLSQLNKEIKNNRWDSPDYWLRFGTSLLSGGMSGFQTGYGLAGTFNNASGYNTNLNGKGGKASTGTLG